MIKFLKITTDFANTESKVTKPLEKAIMDIAI